MRQRSWLSVLIWLSSWTASPIATGAKLPGLMGMISTALLTKSRNDFSNWKTTSVLPLMLTAANSTPMSQDDMQLYADGILLAYCGITPSARIEKERQDFAEALKKRTTFLANHRNTCRSRKPAQAPKAEA